MTEESSAPTVPVVLAKVPSCTCNACGGTTFATSGQGWKVCRKRVSRGSLATRAAASPKVVQQTLAAADVFLRRNGNRPTLDRPTRASGRMKVRPDVDPPMPMTRRAFAQLVAYQVR